MFVKDVDIRYGFAFSTASLLRQSGPWTLVRMRGAPVRCLFGPREHTIAARSAGQIERMHYSFDWPFAGAVHQDMHLLASRWCEPMPMLNNFGQM